MADETIPASAVISPESMEHSMGVFDRLTSSASTATTTEEAEQLASKASQPAKETEKPKEEAKPADTKLGIPESIITGEPVKKDEAKPENDGLLPEEIPTGHITREHFKKVHTQANEAIKAERAKAAQLTAELETLRAAQTNGKLPEDVQKKLDDYQTKLRDREAELERVAYERSPAFKEKYLERESSVKSQLSSIAKDLSVDSESIESALHASPRRRYEIIDGLEIAESAKADLTSLMRQHDQIQSEKKQALDKSAEAIAAHHEKQAEQQRQQEARQRQEEDKVFTEALADAQKKIAPFQKLDPSIEGATEWNKQVDSLQERAKSFFNGEMNIRGMADIALAGLAYEPLSAINGVLRERLKAVMAENSRLKSASPGGGEPGKINGDDKGLSSEERAMRTFDDMQARAANGGFSHAVSSGGVI